MTDVALSKNYSEVKISLLSAKLDAERVRINRLMRAMGIDKYEEEKLDNES